MRKGFITDSFLISLFLVCVFAVPYAAKAQEENLSLTVTPPMFQLTISPGEFWASTVKVANTNPYDITVYASAVNFYQKGEDGQGITMVPLNEEGGSGSSLASWISLPQESVVIPKGKSEEIPFTVRIPLDADPGSHYAALLVGTRPPQLPGKESRIHVSSMVSSLLFVRIKGDIREAAFIREFTADRGARTNNGADFLLRFENTGNVHVRPQGDIVIYDMWGRERGKVFINKDTEFGNVLPKTIRKFNIAWDDASNASLLSLGRHKAVVTLTYGDDARQSSSATTYYWVMPTRTIAGIVLALVLPMYVIVFFVRRSIRKTLERETGVRMKNNQGVRKRISAILFALFIITLIFLIVVGDDASWLLDAAGLIARNILYGKTVQFP